jgi:hypothetical protein
METLRQARLLARFVLACFALALGTAIASPLVNAQGMELVCSSAGTVKLVQTGGDSGEPSAHTLDCPLCLPGGAPSPQSAPAVPQAEPLAQAQPTATVTHVAGRTAAPLPPRGPPALG